MSINKKDNVLTTITPMALVPDYIRDAQHSLNAKFAFVRAALPPTAYDVVRALEELCEIVDRFLSLFWQLPLTRNSHWIARGCLDDLYITAYAVTDGAIAQLLYRGPLVHNLIAAMAVPVLWIAIEGILWLRENTWVWARGKERVMRFFHRTD